MKSEDIITENSYAEKGEQYPFMVVRSDLALNAIKEAKNEIKEKAISAYKNACPFNSDGCCQIKKDAGECECNELSDFIEQLNSSLLQRGEPFGSVK